ncbi:odorant receptor 85f-like [Epargyreus clarus]|uniref:odorant receptor 85f-like n=1 Tax=Epargyreus clarus TaxID=520877 RepID=UPI003C2E9F3F
MHFFSFISELGNVFGAIFALHVIFLSGVICFYCVAAMINGRLEDLKNLMGSVISIIMIFHCCYNGQLLSDSAVDVGTAIYDSNWYSLSSAHKKIVLITMLRSQRVTYIKSTSYTHVSLTTFVKIMNMAWSFISLITRMYEEE